MTYIQSTFLLLISLITTVNVYGQNDLLISVQEEGVQLDWTANPAATSYIVEIATDVDVFGDLAYKAVAFIEAGMLNETSYFMDDIVEEGLVYFKVKEFDHLGNEIVAHTNTANYLQQDYFTASTHADPTFSNLFVDLVTTSTAEVAFSVESTDGENYFAGSFPTVKGNNAFTLPMAPTMESGMYILTIACNDGTQHILLEKEEAPAFMVTVD